MELHKLKSAKGSRHKKTRKGRGHAAGKGKTAGRGDKGQNKRSGGGTRPGFEGGQNPWFRRLPKRGFKNFNHTRYQIITLKKLDEHFANKTEINPKTLLAKHLIKNDKLPIKILGNEQIKKIWTIKVAAISKNAKLIVEKVGGSFEAKK